MMDYDFIKNKLKNYQSSNNRLTLSDAIQSIEEDGTHNMNASLLTSLLCRLRTVVPRDPETPTPQNPSIMKYKIKLL